MRLKNTVIYVNKFCQFQEKINQKKESVAESLVKNDKSLIEKVEESEQKIFYSKNAKRQNLKKTYNEFKEL